MRTGPMKIGFVGLGQMGLVMAPPAHRLADIGLAFIDATVSGGVARARTAELTIMAGGTKPTPR